MAAFWLYLGTGPEGQKISFDGRSRALEKCLITATRWYSKRLIASRWNAAPSSRPRHVEAECYRPINPFQRGVRNAILPTGYFLRNARVSWALYSSRAGNSPSKAQAHVFEWVHTGGYNVSSVSPPATLLARELPSHGPRRRRPPPATLIIRRSSIPEPPAWHRGHHGFAVGYNLGGVVPTGSGA